MHRSPLTGPDRRPAEGDVARSFDQSGLRIMVAGGTRTGHRYPANFDVLHVDGEDTTALPTGSLSEPCIQPYVIMDLNLGYDLPWVRGASIQMVMNNVLGTEYTSFVGVPAIGRFTMVRLRYEF